MEKASEAILALKPVTFHYKRNIDHDCTVQFGLIAEDVEKIDPALVLLDKEGKPYSVRYDALNVMLLNQFLKEHKAFVEETTQNARAGATVARLQRQVEILTAGLQKVSAQLEASTPAPQTVLNDQ